MEPKEMWVLPAGSTYWWNRTGEELEALESRDARAGRFYDSAGEPLIYSDVGSGTLKEDTVFALLRRRGIAWKGWGRRPTGLMLGIATIDGIPREIMTRRPPLRGAKQDNKEVR